VFNQGNQSAGLPKPTDERDVTSNRNANAKMFKIVGHPWVRLRYPRDDLGVVFKGRADVVPVEHEPRQPMIDQDLSHKNQSPDRRGNGSPIGILGGSSGARSCVWVVSAGDSECWSRVRRFRLDLDEAEGNAAACGLPHPEIFQSTRTAGWRPLLVN